ncbi:MAG: HAD-IA family hydrolase [Chromatiales bacterium]
MAAGLDITTILFDLDGTLLDTAPDLASALNRLLEEEGREPLAFERVRNQVSHGSLALVRLGFGSEQRPEDFERRRTRLLEIYRSNLYLETAPFPGMEALLAYLERKGLRWGVVTNKPAWLTDPLMDAMRLSARAACVVSGDTTDRRKPDPMPLLHACDLAGSVATECIYVGDARRDVEAGQAARMGTLVARYGYIEADEQPEDWGADALIDEPREILDWLLDAQNRKVAG